MFHYQLYYTASDYANLDLKPGILSTVANITGTDEVKACTNTSTVYSRNNWLVTLDTNSFQQQSIYVGRIFIFIKFHQIQRVIRQKHSKKILFHFLHCKVAGFIMSFLTKMLKTGQLPPQQHIHDVPTCDLLVTHPMLQLPHHHQATILSAFHYNLFE